MVCLRCGRLGYPDPETGYNADTLCPRCLELEEAHEILSEFLQTIDLLDAVAAPISDALSSFHKPETTLLQLLGRLTREIREVVNRAC